MKQICLTFLLLFISFNIYSQEQNVQQDFSKFHNFFEPEVHHHNWTYQVKGTHNEVKFVFTLLFVVYKEIFSSQDVDSCVFTPSCSVYAVESVKKHGVIYGIMDAFDRLTRCNPAPKNFPIDPVTHKYYDPVE